MEINIKAQIVNELHEVASKYIETYLVADIIAVIVQYAAVSSFSIKDEAEAMEFMRDIIYDAAVIVRNAKAKAQDSNER